MMMRMLEAGGIPLVTDGVRQADPDNPCGYFEYQPVKRLRRDGSWVPSARGKALKVVSPLLEALPSMCRYDVIFMERNLDEVLASQQVMLTNNSTGSFCTKDVQAAPFRQGDERLKTAYLNHLEQTRLWLKTRDNMRVLYVGYEKVLKAPGEAANQIAHFLRVSLNESAMVFAVMPTLRRQRTQDCPGQPKTSV